MEEYWYVESERLASCMYTLPLMFQYTLYAYGCPFVIAAASATCSYITVDTFSNNYTYCTKNVQHKIHQIFTEANTAIIRLRL